MTIKKHRDLLRFLHLSILKECTPGAFEASGGWTMQTKPFNDSTANGLTKCIETFVRGQGGYFNRISSTGLMRKIGGEMKWTTGNSNIGAADCRILFQGRSIDCEIKIGRDVMSRAQEQEKARVERAGGIYIIANSFDHFLKQWQAVGFTIPQIDKTLC